MILEEGNMKRLVTYVREGLNVKLREDLMDSNFCSIWLEVNLKQGGEIIGCLFVSFTGNIEFMELIIRKKWKSNG